LIGGAIVGEIGLAVAAPIALPMIGFTATGVAGGSMAAIAQAYITPIAAGSAFSALQSAGAAGLGLGTKIALTGIGAAVGGAAGKKLGDNSDD